MTKRLYQSKAYVRQRNQSNLESPATWHCQTAHSIDTLCLIVYRTMNQPRGCCLLEHHQYCDLTLPIWPMIVTAVNVCSTLGLYRSLHNALLDTCGPNFASCLVGHALCSLHASRTVMSSLMAKPHVLHCLIQHCA